MKHKLLTIFLVTTLIISFIPQVSASPNSLIEGLTTLVDSKIDWTAASDASWAFDQIGTKIRAYSWGFISATELDAWINNLTSASLVLYAYAQVKKYNIENETKIKWALNAMPIMSNGLPLQGAGYYYIQHRYLLRGYYWAEKYNYLTSKWNITKAYENFKYAIDHATYPAGYQVYEDNTVSMSGSPRYYDEAACTMDNFITFYELGITSAINDAVNCWNWINNNYWTTVYDGKPVGYYKYSLLSNDWECEAGGFLQIALKLKYYAPNAGNLSRIQTDMSYRFLANRWRSYQWNGWNTKYAVVHAYYGSDETRLGNTLMAWASLFGAYFLLTTEQRDNLTDLITGYDTYDPAWELLYSTATDLYNSTSGLFKEISSSTHRNYATTWAADLLLLFGIVPDTGCLAVPLSEMAYEDRLNIVDRDILSLNLTTRTLRIGIYVPGVVNFQYNGTTNNNFAEQGLYDVNFSSNWNTITSAVKVSELPSNRIYLFGDVNAPTYSNIGYSTTTTGQQCTFSCKWMDDTATSGFIFSWNSTGNVWQNDTWASLSGNPAWANVTKTLPPESGVVQGFRWYCNDTTNNWNDTGIQTLTTTAFGANTVVLTYPTDNMHIHLNNFAFFFQPTFFQPIQNASLWLNLSATWQRATWNSSSVKNATTDSISFVFSAYGSATYIWNIEVFNLTHSIFATANYTVLVEISPIWTTVGYNSTAQSLPCKFYSYWIDYGGVDYAGLSGFVFGWNGSGSMVNDTWVTLASAISAWANVTKTLPSDGGTRIEFQFWVNDTDGWWNTTGLNFLVTVSNAPTYSLVAYNTTLVGTNCLFSCYWQDDSALSGYIFSFYNGTWYNDTWTSLSGAGAWANKTKTLPNILSTTISFIWYCNDSDNLWASTTTYSFSTTGFSWYFSFYDLDSNNVKARINWEIWQGAQYIGYVEGTSTLLNGTYQLKTFYHDYLIQTSSIDTITYGSGSTIYFYPVMKKLGSLNQYATFNQSITTINILTATDTLIQFSVTSGATDFLMMIDVAQNATYLMKDGVDQTDWWYDDYLGCILLRTATLSTWELAFPSPPPPPSLPEVSIDISLMQYLYAGNFVGFIIACYTTRIGQGFYAIIMLIIFGVLYNKTKSLALCGITWLLIGTALIVAMPVISPIVVVFVTFGLAGIIYDLIEARNR